MPIIRDQLNGPTPQNLSLQGQPGPNFENEGQRTTSDIQALANSNALQASQDLLTGRLQGSFLTLSDPPVSVPNAFAGRPYYPILGGPYRDRGPREGRY